MSFYSSLNLIGEELPEDFDLAEIKDLALECGLIRDEVTRWCDSSWFLEKEISTIFYTEERWSLNDRLFLPDTFSIGRRFSCTAMEEEQCWEADGLSVRFHGGGYLYPLTMNEVSTHLREHDGISHFVGRLTSLVPVSKIDPPNEYESLMSAITIDIPDSRLVWTMCETG